MVLTRESILSRLKELDTILEELSQYRDKTLEDLAGSLSLRWTVERGLIAGANLIFDVADHILAGQFGVYPETYEDSLAGLEQKKVISKGLYRKMKGLGGFRNVLVHDYLGIDLSELHGNLSKAFKVFPAFSSEVQKWLKHIQ